MTLVLTRRADITLRCFHDVAWRGSAVRIADCALERIADCRRSFLRLIATDPQAVVYGVTTAMGERAGERLTDGQQSRHARLKPLAAATSFGEDLPERIVRGIVLARLTNFIEGHAATTPRLAQAVAHMLDGDPMPVVPAAGQGGAGEILALYPLFAPLSTRFVLEVKERGSLINGSPCAAALLADAAIAARRRLETALRTFALSIEAFGAPLEHYDKALEQLWGDRGEAAALHALRGHLLGAATARRSVQAPVSYRIVPRVLGHTYRAVVSAEEAATISLASVSDNPVYLPPDERHPNGRCISTGGYHNAMAAPALDDLAATWADLTVLCDRHSAKLLDDRISNLPHQLMVGRAAGESDGHGSVGYIPMASNGYSELARNAAQTTLLPGGDSGASGQDDVAAPAFIAWSKQVRAGACIDASLATLAVLASQALYVTHRAAPPALRGFLDTVRAHVPPVEADRILGPELRSLADSFTADAFSAVAPLRLGYAATPA